MVNLSEHRIFATLSQGTPKFKLLLLLSFISAIMNPTCVWNVPNLNIDQVLWYHDKGFSKFFSVLETRQWVDQPDFNSW
jgi:hypothetical protein